VTGFHIAIGIIGCAASLFVASQATVACIAGERESRTWDALVATPLTARSIVYQKFLGSLWRIGIGPALLTLHFVVFGIIGITHPLGALHVGMIVFGFSVFLAGTGLLFSLLVRKSAVAGALNIGLGIGLWIGLPLAIGFVLGAVMQVGQDVFEPVATVGVFGHPVFMLINGVLMAAENGTALDSGMSIPSGAYGDILRLRALGPIAFTAFYSASSLGAVLVGVGAVEIAVRVFPKRGGRA
jgi:ABC-type transport system involved in multi-copper enzyme maturation permease subunit